MAGVVTGVVETESTLAGAETTMLVIVATAARARRRVLMCIVAAWGVGRSEWGEKLRREEEEENQ